MRDIAVRSCCRYARRVHRERQRNFDPPEIGRRARRQQPREHRSSTGVFPDRDRRRRRRMRWSISHSTTIIVSHFVSRHETSCGFAVPRCDEAMEKFERKRVCWAKIYRYMARTTTYRDGRAQFTDVRHERRFYRDEITRAKQTASSNRAA